MVSRSLSIMICCYEEDFMYIKKINHLEVIIKVAERCNLNCSYCYFFHGEDDSFKKHPARISGEVIDKLADFIYNGCKDFNIDSVNIDFHGGEPLLLDKRFFIQYCDNFKKKLPKNIKLQFKVQTNGVLLSEEWLKLFKKYDFKIGVSLDGTEEMNDSHRNDHKGNGSYHSVIKGIKLAQNFGYEDIAILCVVNAKASAKLIYRHFVDDIKVHNIDFLLPYVSYDTIASVTAKEFGFFLKDLLNEWFRDDNPKVNIRILNNTLAMLLGKNSTLITQGSNINNAVAITVASNGDLFPDDVLRSSKWDYANNGHSVHEISLKDLLGTKGFKILRKAAGFTPDECKSCKWLNICGSGELVHRHSNENGFNNKSILCEGLKIYFDRAYTCLTDAGISPNKLNINNNAYAEKD